jgi:Alpha-glutamyl/putrescinyl thymine pyrophosphorylase clade 3
MIKERHKKTADTLRSKLELHDKKVRQLEGLGNDQRIECFVAQLIDSIRRVEYASYLREADHSTLRAQPWSGCFDPLAAAVIHNRNGLAVEAWWLVFLATHFGKHSKDKWALTEAVYGKLKQGSVWDWRTVRADLKGFSDWVKENSEELKNAGRFSNHRKYETINPRSPAGLPSVVTSYVDWISKQNDPSTLVRSIHLKVGQNPIEVFDKLYREMNCVKRFGRLGKFDFLTMLGKLHIAPIAPGSAYITQATGPRLGARLLFRGSTRTTGFDDKLDDWLVELDSTLGLGMQILEDAMCNWQKSPDVHAHFRG